MHFCLNLHSRSPSIFAPARSVENVILQSLLSAGVAWSVFSPFPPPLSSFFLSSPHDRFAVSSSSPLYSFGSPTSSPQLCSCHRHLPPPTSLLCCNCTCDAIYPSPHTCTFSTSFSSAFSSCCGLRKCSSRILMPPLRGSSRGRRISRSAVEERS